MGSGNFQCRENTAVFETKLFAARIIHAQSVSSATTTVLTATSLLFLP